MNYIRTEKEILDINNTNKYIYVIRDNSILKSECRYVSYISDWREYFLIDYQNCIHFSYNSAQNFISDLIKETLKYQNLVIELSPYYKDCKQADTIEELCDEFVVHSEINNAHYIMDWFDLCEELADDRFYPTDEIYGAIWTNNGLKYVAKLVDGGELELL